ncbi:MAG: adenylyltransferase, partial [Desulfovermiculus sp.]
MNAYSESLLVHFRRVEHLKKEVAGSPSISLNERQVCDLELLCNRAFYPLTGFMTAAEYESVLDQGRLPDSTLWPLPICLDVNEKTASRLEPGQTLGLCDGEGFLLAVMHVQQIWQPDKRKEAALIYGTEDANLHPSVYHLFHRTQPFYV